MAGLVLQSSHAGESLGKLQPIITPSKSAQPKTCFFTVNEAVISSGGSGGSGGPGGVTGSSTSPITVLLLLFIQINLKSFISESSTPLPANELVSVLPSWASAANPSPRNGGNTSSSNPLTFTLILLQLIFFTITLSLDLSLL